MLRWSCVVCNVGRPVDWIVHEDPIICRYCVDERPEQVADLLEEEDDDDSEQVGMGEFA